MAAFDTPFIVPVGAFAVAIVAILAGALGHAHARRLRAQQCLGMLSRGLSVAEMERLLRIPDEPNSTRANSLERRLATSRRAAAVLISFGVGLGLFFITLAALLHVREVLSGAAASLIPLCLGLGFAVEHRLLTHARERANPASNPA